MAHNVDGVVALSRALRDLYAERPVELLFGVMADKDYPAMLRAISESVHGVHLCPPLTPRSLDPARCASVVAELGLPCASYLTCEEALRAARDAAGFDGLVCATGSFSVVGEVRRLLRVDGSVEAGAVR